MKIVMELPKEIPKKPKLKDSSRRSDGSKGDKLFKPPFATGNIRKQTTFPGKIWLCIPLDIRLKSLLHKLIAEL